MSKFNEMPIILIQWNQENTSKTYYNFTDREEAVKFIFKLYEEYLVSEENVNKRGSVKIVKLSEAVSFIYSLYDFAYLELKIKENGNKVYVPYGKDWFSEILIKSINK